MRGDVVVVRAFGGEPLIRLVWGDSADTVYISVQEQFALLAKGLDAIPPVGFPRADVFQYEPAIEAAISSGTINWKRLQPYTGGRQ